MNDTFELEVHSDGLLVWATNWKGGKGLAAEFVYNMDMHEIAQEIYEILAASGNVVKFKGG